MLSEINTQKQLQILEKLLAQLDTDEHRIQFLRQLLFKKTKSRSIYEVEELVYITKDMDYFQQLNSKKINVEQKVHHRLCQYLRINFIRKGTTIYTYQSHPESFYLVFYGKALTLKPKPTQSIEQERDQPEINKLFEKNKVLIEFLKNPYIKIQHWPHKVPFTIKRLLAIRWFQMLVRKLIYAGFIYKRLVPKRKQTPFTSPSRNKRRTRVSSMVLSYIYGPLFQEELFQSIRDEIMNRYNPHLDLGQISNAPHYFKGNVFIYDIDEEINPGSQFGVTKGFIPKTIVTIEDSMVGVLGKNQYHLAMQLPNLAKQQKKIKFIIKHFLQNLNIFSNRKLTKMTYMLGSKHVDIGRRFIRQGDLINKIYLIYKGQVELYVTEKNSEKRLIILQHGDMILSENIFFHLKQSVYSAKAFDSKVKLLQISMRDFFNVIGDDQSLYDTLRETSKNRLEFLMKRIQDTQSQVVLEFDKALPRFEIQNIYKISTVQQVEVAFYNRCDEYKRQQEKGKIVESNCETKTEQVRMIFKRHQEEVKQIKEQYSPNDILTERKKESFVQVQYDLKRYLVKRNLIKTKQKQLVEQPQVSNHQESQKQIQKYAEPDISIIKPIHQENIKNQQVSGIFPNRKRKVSSSTISIRQIRQRCSHDQIDGINSARERSRILSALTQFKDQGMQADLLQKMMDPKSFSQNEYIMNNNTSVISKTHITDLNNDTVATERHRRRVQRSVSMIKQQFRQKSQDYQKQIILNCLKGRIG